MSGILQATFRKLRHHSRRSRYELIYQLLEMDRLAGLVLDLGGGPASFFSAMFSHPEQIILADVDFNLVRRARRAMPALQAIVADGGKLPFARRSIDVTVCNSVIEHVDHPDLLAKEIQRTSRNYFVQTPNGQFPLETHSLIAIPFYNIIPGTGLRRFICRIFGANFEYVSSVRYLSERRLRFLFPNANLTYERFLGLKKSFYIYQRGGDSK